MTEHETRIIDNKGAPPELVRLAHTIIEECEEVGTIKAVIFDAYIKELEGNCGGFNPNTRTLVVDMGVCVIKKEWMKKGIMYIPNVWFNLLFTLFHEASHAMQLAEDPTLAAVNELPEEYEVEADKAAERALIDWASDHDVPTLNEMGWVGDQIKEVLNKLYTQQPETVIEELAIEGTKAAANALHAALASSGEDDDRAVILKGIEEGNTGVIIKGKKYLTAYEAISTY